MMKLANIIGIAVTCSVAVCPSCQHRQMPPARCSAYLYEGRDVGVSSLHLKDILERHPEARIGNPNCSYRLPECRLRIRPGRRQTLFKRLEQDMPFVREFTDMLPDAMPKTGDVGTILPIYYIPRGCSAYEHCAEVVTFLSPKEMDYYFEAEGNKCTHERQTVNWLFGEDGFMRGEDVEESARWWEDELRRGKKENAYKLAHSYHMGWVRGKSSRDAIPLYLAAVECGSNGKAHYAQYELGICYRDGAGVPQSHQEAAKWFRRAAETDFCAESQYELGCCYMEGRGVERSRREAVKWFRKAARNGCRKARAALHALM